MPPDDDRLDEIKREQGEAILRAFVEEKHRRDEALRAALTAAMADTETEEHDGDDD